MKQSDGLNITFNVTESVAKFLIKGFYIMLGVIILALIIIKVGAPLKFEKDSSIKVELTPEARQKKD